MAKVRSPMVASTRTAAVDAECSRRRESTSDSGWINSDRYCGAAPFRQRCTRTQSLYWMHSGTRSQCRFNQYITRLKWHSESTHLYQVHSYVCHVTCSLKQAIPSGRPFRLRSLKFLSPTMVKIPSKISHMQIQIQMTSKI